MTKYRTWFITFLLHHCYEEGLQMNDFLTGLKRGFYMVKTKLLIYLHQLQYLIKIVM